MTLRTSFLVAVPFTVLALLAGCGGAAPPAAPADKRAPVAVPVRVAEAAQVPDFAQATGTVEPLRRVSPGTKLMGRVESVPVREGDRVAAGQVLARLDSRDLAAGVGQAEAGVKMATAQFENAHAMHERIDRLTARGSATAKNLEDATAGLRTTEAGVEQAKANLAAAKVMLGYAEVRSPIAGVVTAKRIEAGDMAAPGMPLFTVEDLSRAKIAVRVPESDVVGLTAGGPAKIRIDVLGEDRDATIDRVIPAGDPMSRTFEVQLLLDNRDGRIQSGMFARARFPKATRTALSVPKGAVVARGELTGVFVVEADGVARLRWIRAGREDGGQVEVLSGLAAGERFVAEPPPGFADGTPVTSTTAAR